MNIRRTEKDTEHFRCRGQCTAGACPLEVCVRTGRKRRRVARRGLSVSVYPDAAEHASGAGLAIDIGTTTVEMMLCDLQTGTPIASAAERNAQAVFGADVISRIEHARDVPHGTEQLHETVRAQIGVMFQALLGAAGMDVQNVGGACVAGNTTMLHLAAGLSPASMGAHPYPVQSLFGNTVPGDVLGMPDRLEAYLAPCVSAFIGADVVCGGIAVGANRSTGTGMLVDLGTNGELLVWNNGRYAAASTAMGPVFEGGGITCGMPALPGAVRHITVVNGAIHLETVDGAPPAGLCGSGIIDAAAAALRLGSIDCMGAIVPDAPYVSRESETGGLMFTVANEVLLLQKDIRELQAAKAAVAAGEKTLLADLGISEEDLESLSIAGGLGNAADPASAAAIGLVPIAESTAGVGNAALRGAMRLALDPEQRRGAEAFAQSVVPHDLALSAVFSDLYIENMCFDQGVDI